MTPHLLKQKNLLFWLKAQKQMLGKLLSYKDLLYKFFYKYYVENYLEYLKFETQVKYIGVGEGIDDLQVFNKNEFVDSFFK